MAIRDAALIGALLTRLTTIVTCATSTGIITCRSTMICPCPVEAPLGAPGPLTRRINVFLCRCMWWSMALADVACWVLVEVVLRSRPHIRVDLLGSFSEILVIAQYLPMVVMDVAALILVFPSAIAHLCPKWPARAASPAPRTVAFLADLPRPLAMRSGPRARTRAINCTACSSTAWSGTPMPSLGSAKAIWAHHVP